MEHKKQFTGFVMLMALFVGATFFATTSYVSAHEKAHAQTCKYFGGTPNITYSDLGLKGETCCQAFEGDLECLGADVPERHLADALIEGFGYQTQAYAGGSMLFSLLIFSVVMIILARDLTRG